ncbi:MAG: hypothetical protein ACI4IL_08525 [Eubacterium sp.]
MDGTTFSKKPRLKILVVLHVILTIITAVLLIIFTLNRLLINYGYVYPYDNGFSIEYSPLYSAISIGLAVLLAFLLICSLIRFDYLKQQIIAWSIGIIIVIGIICAGHIAMSIPQTTEYFNTKSSEELLQDFPIDNYSYDEGSDDFYYLKNVIIGNTYWAGSSSYKNFSNKKTDDNYYNIENINPNSAVFMNYYYLRDESGKRIKDYLRNKEFHDLFSTEEYTSNSLEENYNIYEYEDSYEIILIEDNQVFYLSASKNDKIKYSLDDLVVTAKKLHKYLYSQSEAVCTGDGDLFC